MTSEVNGVQIVFDAQKLREILGIPVTRFDIYVREDKSLLSKVRLLELAKDRVSNQGSNTHKQ